MLRVYLLRPWCNFSGPAVRKARYDPGLGLKSFGIDSGADAVPDEATVCKCWQLLERTKLGKLLLTAVSAHLGAHGIRIAHGMIVDATIFSAPSSTKSRKGERYPKMHQTANSRQWYFEMKTHVGVGNRTMLTERLLSAINVERPAETANVNPDSHRHYRMYHRTDRFSELPYRQNASGADEVVERATRW